MTKKLIILALAISAFGLATALQAGGKHRGKSLEAQVESLALSDSDAQAVTDILQQQFEAMQILREAHHREAEVLAETTREQLGAILSEEQIESLRLGHRSRHMRKRGGSRHGKDN